MRKILVLASGFAAIACAANAQCGAKTKFTASATEFIKANGDTDTKPGTVILTAGKDSVDVSIDGDAHEMKGSVMDYNCNFTDAKNGTISFKSELIDNGGDPRHATFTINTKDGKTTVLVVAEEEETKIRLTIDSSEVVK